MGLLFSALNLDGDAGSLLCQYSRGEFELKGEVSNGDESPVNMLFYSYISLLYPEILPQPSHPCGLIVTRRIAPPLHRPKLSKRSC